MRLHPNSRNFPLLLVLCLLSLSSCIENNATLSQDKFLPPKDPTPEYTQVPMTPQHWKIIYDGYGDVRFTEEGIALEPFATQDPAQTHAALVTLNSDLHPTPKNFKARILYKTLSQLRTPQPNAWEVFWFMFNTQIVGGHFMSANYLIQKPVHGFEIGRAFTSDQQEFLATDSSFPLNINETNELEILKNHQSLSIWQNGILKLQYEGNDSSPTNHLFDEKGEFALYTEDAAVEIYEFSYIDLDRQLESSL